MKRIGMIDDHFKDDEGGEGGDEDVQQCLQPFAPSMQLFNFLTTHMVEFNFDLGEFIETRK